MNLDSDGEEAFAAFIEMIKSNRTRVRIAVGLGLDIVTGSD